MVRTAAALMLCATIGVACSPDYSGAGEGSTATPQVPTGTSTGQPADESIGSTGSTAPVDPDDTGTTAPVDPPTTGDSTTGSSTSTSVDTGDTESVPIEIERCDTVDLPIPDNDSNGAVSSIDIEVVGGGTIVSLALVVQVTHTWVGDLRVELHKDSAEVVVIDRPEAPDRTTCNGDDIDVLLYDAAADPIAGQCMDDDAGPPPALAGDLQPESPLDPMFGGLEMNGPWRLFVTDNNAMDTGTLHQWCLRITYR
jgi:hypothetical protein